MYQQKYDAGAMHLQTKIGITQHNQRNDATDGHRRSKTDFHMQFDHQLDQHIFSLSNKSAAHPKEAATTKEKTKMYFGTVSSWHDDRGFGFITSDGPIDGIAYRDVFLHAKKLPKGIQTIARGARVEFVTVPARAPGKPHEARVVRVINELAEAA
jgi:cold shock CspA family protein